MHPSRLQEIEASNAVVYCWSGYSDGTYTRANIKRYLALKNPGTKLVLGPWDHGNVHMIDPNEVKPKVHFDDIGEIIRFFDHHLKGDQNRIESEPPIHYYTMGEGRWKTAKVWPPPDSKARPITLDLTTHASWTRYRKRPRVIHTRSISQPPPVQPQDGYHWKKDRLSQLP